MKAAIKKYDKTFIHTKKWIRIEKYLRNELKVTSFEWKSIKQEIAQIKDTPYSGVIEEAFFEEMFPSPFQFSFRKAGSSARGPFSQPKSLNSVIILRARVFGDFVMHWAEAFIQSPGFNIICDRLDLEKSAGLDYFGPPRLKNLFLFWAMEHFPVLMQSLWGYSYHKKLSPLRRMKFNDFAQYVPEFVLYNAFEMISLPKHLVWVRHLASGYNMRSAPYQHLPLSKKMAHWINYAPRDAFFDQAILFGLIKANGGGIELYEFFKGYSRNLHNSFERLCQICHFLARFEDQLYNLEPTRLIGYLEHLFIENENFSFKGRTLNSISREMSAYYEEINRQQQLLYRRRPLYGDPNFNSYTPSTWKPVDIQNFEMEKHDNRQNETYYYSIQQITRLEDLIREGSILSHCVGSYHSRCVSGSSIIWSLKIRPGAIGDNKGPFTGKNRITIEVDDQKRIVQARGHHNSFPKPTEEEVILAWAKQEGLKVLRY